MTASSRFATAVHILTLLALREDEALTSDYIAESVNTNPVVVRRILARLAAAGLVESTPGTAGGSRLALDARRITLREVYEAVESGQLFGRHSQEPNSKCRVGRMIVSILAPRFNAAEHAAVASLDRTTVADLRSEVTKRRP